ncbi:MAG: DNA repair protein RecO [Candidatus Eisenbacteria bacterium]
MAIERDDAIVLGRIRFGETSLIATLFTRRRGPVKVIAKGARKGRSRFAGVLEPSNRIHAVYYRKENRDLYLLSQADVVRSFGGLRESLLRLAYGYAIIGTLAGLKREETPAGRLFDLAVDAFEAVETAETWGLEPALWGFLLSALADAGYRPELERCLRCGKSSPMEKGARFDPRDGGVLCPAHGEGGLLLSAGALDALRRLSKGGAPAAPLTPRETAEGREGLRRFFVEHGLGRAPFRSLDLLRTDGGRRRP